MDKQRFSVAVRPSIKEVERGGYYYEEAYYEDREEVYECATAEEAIAKYKVDYVNFLQQAEKRFIRAIPISNYFRLSYYLRKQYPEGKKVQEFISELVDK